MIRIIRIILKAVWQLLTLAAPQPDDQENGVDTGGQGRVSWRQT